MGQLARHATFSIFHFPFIIAGAGEIRIATTNDLKKMSNDKWKMSYSAACRLFLPPAPAVCLLPPSSYLGCFSQFPKLRVRCCYLFLANQPDSFCQTEQFQSTNPIPVYVNFIPG